MYKVICIDAQDGIDEFPYDTIGKRLIEGDVYTVVDEWIGFGTKGDVPYPCYQLAEFDPRDGFEKTRFIPLSNADETIIHENHFQTQNA